MKHSFEEFVDDMNSKEEVFKHLNDFFGLREDGKEEAFLKWFYGE